MNNLEEVALLVKSCTDCSLHRDRTNAVPGEGPADAELMFIGEGPGFQEDKQGLPFVGAAGQFLEALLASIGTTRQQVFIANMIKCRPPQNRDPSPIEIAACSKYLDRQIELINPKLIVTLDGFLWDGFFRGKAYRGPEARSGKRTADSYIPSCTRRLPSTGRSYGAS